MQAVVRKISCDRCLGVEYVPGGEAAPAMAVLKLEYGGKSVEFFDLCTKCSTTVARAVDQLTRSKPGSSKRSAKKRGPARVQAPDKPS